jgi:hypothetical protein
MRAYLHQGMTDLCADRTEKLCNTEPSFHSSLAGAAGEGLLHGGLVQAFS